MQPIGTAAANVLQASQNEPIKPCEKPSQRSNSQQVAALVRQSYDIFQTYGKDPEALKSQILGFNQALKGYEQADIDSAFYGWLKISRIMPTPADIIEFVELAIRDRAEAKLYAGAKAVPAKIAPAAIIPWFGLQWKQFTDQHRSQLATHLDDLGEKAWEYIKYLHASVGAPGLMDPIWSRWRPSAN